MKYAHALFLLLGAYLLYEPGCTAIKIFFLYCLLILGLFDFAVDFFGDTAAFRNWLDRWF